MCAFVIRYGRVRIGCYFVLVVLLVLVVFHFRMLRYAVQWFMWYHVAVLTYFSHLLGYFYLSFSGPSVWLVIIIERKMNIIWFGSVWDWMVAIATMTTTVRVTCLILMQSADRILSIEAFILQISIENWIRLIYTYLNPIYSTQSISSIFLFLIEERG